MIINWGLMINTSDFSLRHTIESGQPLTFYSNYSQSNGIESLKYVTMKGEISLSVKDDKISYDYAGDYSENSARKEILERFSLKEDMGQIYKGIGTDKFMNKAIKDFHGMRITRNDPWETTMCFLISQFNNMKRIRLIVNNLINQFGETKDGYKLFPTPEAIAQTDLRTLRKCGTGFRDKYLLSVAQDFSSGFDKNRLYKMKYDDAKQKLMELDGIGDKVADCILLFGYNKLEAFPIDTWVKRGVEYVYFNKRKKTIKRIHEFVESRWPTQYLGYAQQYLYWQCRENNIG